MPQIASLDPFVLKIFQRGMPPYPPRGSCPPGTQTTPAAYFKNLADYFQIYGEHCISLSSFFWLVYQSNFSRVPNFSEAY